MCANDYIYLDSQSIQHICHVKRDRKTFYNAQENVQMPYLWILILSKFNLQEEIYRESSCQ